MSGATGRDEQPVRRLGDDPGRAVGTERPARPALLRYALVSVPVALAAMLAVQIAWYERDIVTWAPDWPSIAFAAAFALVLTSAVSLLTRRLLASTALAFGAMVLLAVVSVVKYSHMRSSLYALDVYNYATLADLKSFYTKFFTQLLVSLAAIAAALIMTWLMFAADRTRVRRRDSAVVLGLAALALVGAYQWRGYRGKIYHYFPGHHVSAPIASIPEAFSMSGFLENADRGGTIDSAPAPHLQNARPGETPPTIIAVLHESSFPTGIFPIQCGGRAPDALYTSSNGRKYDLRVETYNGSTWMTEYGLVLGLSTFYFGDNRIWAAYPMEGRIHDGLAVQMRRNGYRSVAVYPSEKTFLNTGRFYASLGFDALRDKDDQGAPTEFERDRFYYGNVVEEIRAHKASGATSPLFVFTWINATHAPFHFARHPDVPPPPESICAKDREWAEYIRRLLLSEDDLAWLTERLKAEFPGERFMIFGFGDHHPHLSREFLEPNASNPFTPLRGSVGYKTFFRINGVNFEPDWSVVPPSIDAPFLGNVMMLAARLPRHGFYNDRDKLMELCAGRYSDCPRQDEILSFHHRLVTSSTIDNR